MTTIKPYIDLGWHTVPLKGQLVRLNGTSEKSLPIFEKDWRSKYTKTFNTFESELGGAITGAVSNIIAIDCDNQPTFELFRSLDPDYKFVFKSIGKDGGTIVYLFDADIADTFKAVTKDFNGVALLKLDYYANDGFIYLATDANKTKQAPESLELAEPPLAVKILLQSIYQLVKSRVLSNMASNAQPGKHGFKIMPLLEVFLKEKEYSPSLFKILTPHSFRNSVYQKQGHLHPNQVEEGRGSEYLSKIAAILASDISVSAEAFIEALETINNLWDQPMETSRLHATIIERMVSGAATNEEGEPFWKYDEHWDAIGIKATTKLGEYIEVFHDDLKDSFYIINYSIGQFKTYPDQTKALNSYKAVTGELIKSADFYAKLEVLRTISAPHMPYGRLDKNEFNLFVQTEPLKVLTNPVDYAKSYSPPLAFLNFINEFVPDDADREYLLRFIRTKLTTFDYSPVVIYFIGAPGSGKNTFMDLLSLFVGHSYVEEIGAQVFLEKNNAWLMDKHFVQLNELGNSLNSVKDKSEALGKLKLYTGAPKVQVRAMRADPFMYPQTATFVLTANSNPLTLEQDDRRVFYVATPTSLPKTKWVQQYQSIAEARNALLASACDIAYYLATEVKNLDANAYVIAPSSTNKSKLIASTLPISTRIAYYLEHQMFEDLVTECIDNNVDIQALYEQSHNNRVWETALEDLYCAWTGKDTVSPIRKALKDSKLARKYTTVKGENVPYYEVPGLCNLVPFAPGASTPNKPVPKGF